MGILANECVEKEKRSAQELINSAQLAVRLGSPLAKELIYEAANKGNNDADILSAACILATNAGLDDDEEVYRWLHKAAELSGTNGPIRVMNIKDVIDLNPDWNRREKETWRLLSHGELPMFLAAQSLNRSLINLMLFPALANLSEKDPRRRSNISAYSGKRQITPLANHGKLGIEATALLTLGFLNILDKTLDAFDTVYVPHTTLQWLLEEKQKSAFHQPNQIRKAHHLRNLLATDALEQLTPSSKQDSDLSNLVGDELAQLIAEAEKEMDDDIQHIVVRSSPVHRVTSLMEDEANLTTHASVLSSCQSIVDKLLQTGQITAKEGNNASDYLRLQEKPWPDQPEIADGAILYLDGLSIAYFLHLGILDKLKVAGFKPIASPIAIAQFNQLISYETISGEANKIIERIQSALNSRIETGKLKVAARRQKFDEPQKQAIIEDPTSGVFTLAKYCDSIIVDDRSINQHAFIDDSGAHVPIFTTLDLLEGLAIAGSITAEEQVEYLTKLRRAGYFLVPIKDTELINHIYASTVKDGRIIEKAELKAIKESFLCVRMSDWLKMPDETFWLDTSLKSFIQALKDLWRAGTDLSEVRARSIWILNQLEFRGWAQSLGNENGDNFVKVGRGVHLMMLLSPPLNAPQEIKVEYWKWIEENILAPLKEQYPDIFSLIIDWYRSEIDKFANKDLPEGEQSDE